MNPKEIKSIIIEYFELLYLNKLNNLDKLDIFLKKEKITKISFLQEERENYKTPIKCK